MESPEPVELRNTQWHYEKALECLSAGILEDNTGNKDRSIAQYRLGRRHLLQGLEMVSEQNVASQIQLKMNKMLSSVTTRLAVLESTSEASGAQNCYLLPMEPIEKSSTHADRLVASKPFGGASCLPLSPAMASDVPWDLPPAYTPQPTNGNLSVSQSKGMTYPSPPTAELVYHQDDVLFFLPHGVQIFFVTPDGQVSAPSYPGCLRIILNRSQHYHNADINDTRHPPAYLQVSKTFFGLDIIPKALGP